MPRKGVEQSKILYFFLVPHLFEAAKTLRTCGTCSTCSTAYLFSSPESKCGTSGIFHSWRIFRIRNVEVTKCGSHFSNIIYFQCFWSSWPTLGAQDELESISKQQGRQIRLRNGRETNEKRFCETDMGFYDDEVKRCCPAGRKIRFGWHCGRFGGVLRASRGYPQSM